jgi:OmpA-OmpF porin, OOP family
MISRKLTLAVLMLFSILTFAQAQTTTVTNSFPPKPANKWQLGINLGLPTIQGDVPSESFGGAHGPAFGVGLNIRKGLGYVTSLRLQGFYGQAYGQDFIVDEFSYNKTLNGAFFNSPTENYSTGADYTANVWVPNYKTQIGSGSLDLLVNLNNINFHNANPKFLVYAFVGIGAMAYNTKYDALDASDATYDYLTLLSQFGSQNTSEKERLDAIHGILDGDYETQAEVANPGSRDVDETRATWVRNPSLSAGLGLSYRVTDKIEIGLEQRVTYYFDDLADGQRWGYDSAFTDNYDLLSYTSLNVGITLGSEESEDATWQVNPLTYLYDKVAEIDPDNLLKDSDNDGVIDRLDKEPSTPEGTPVDTHGVSLDSDKDGCPDSEDPEPFSSPVLPMENCQNVHLTQDWVENYVDQRLKEYTKGGNGAASDWILPYILFDVNSAKIRPDAVPDLNSVADLMKRYESLNIEVVGHTDTRASEDYNLKLSENRARAAISYLTEKGVKESRLKIVYKGEADVIITGATTEAEHQMNRRVEFHIIK